MKRVPYSPLRPELIRLAIVLLFTTGIRRGELLRLTLGDYNRRDATLLIRNTKFYKSRLLALNGEIVKELERYLRARAQDTEKLNRVLAEHGLIAKWQQFKKKYGADTND